MSASLRDPRDSREMEESGKLVTMLLKESWQYGRTAHDRTGTDLHGSTDTRHDDVVSYVWLLVV